MEQIAYEHMSSGEEQLVCELVKVVFNEFVAPDYDQDGVDNFFCFANAAAMAERVQSGGYVLVAKQSGRLVGMLEFSRPDRIAMLFVSQRGQGIAKELVARAIERARVENPALSKVTVHSSPFAKTAYQKMGFRQTGDIATEQGIRYVPMALLLNNHPKTEMRE
jgi:GNAT superfamily N-acetyltransferase